MAGQCQEDLVEARLADREVSNLDSGGGKLGERGGPPICVDARGGQGGSVWFQRDPAELAGEHSLCLGPLLRIEQTHVERARSHRRLQLTRRPLSDDLAVVDDRDSLGELVGLLEVLSAEQDGGAFGRRAPE